MTWILPPTDRPSPDFQHWLHSHFSAARQGFAAQLLWQRGWRDRVSPDRVPPDQAQQNLVQQTLAQQTLDPRHLAQLSGFLDWRQYTPTGPEAFVEELTSAIDRLTRAYINRENIAIWGDFDADGVTATALLWQGLGQWFGDRLTYFIPDRLRDSHGLSQPGLQNLADRGYRLILTCDTGSTDADLMRWGQDLGLEFIVTDHHTLPPQRPPAVAILNPRQFAPDHPLATLSGVAVAYKLMEAIYNAAADPTSPWPAPQFPRDELLDLVAIGLIADLVELRGDCRYLAQRGLHKLQELTKGHMRRPGVTRLLELCQASGDRPTDIAFGLGPRINAVSRVQGDASLCVDLLTQREVDRCRSLAEQVEVLNLRRKALQRDLQGQIQVRLAQVDWSTTPVIVLGDVGWPVGVLGLVAGQIAQTYQRPTLLLSLDSTPDPLLGVPLARGSARSVGDLNLYDLFQEHSALIHHFGGHPQAAGLSLPIANLPLFKTALEQSLRQAPSLTIRSVASQTPSLDPGQTPSQTLAQPGPTADLIVQVKDLGKALFQELRLLEPYGMGNPTPRLLIQNCWFKGVKHRNLQDHQGRKVRYIYTQFEIWDESYPRGVPGIWWEHYGHELPQGRCDAIVTLGVRPQRPGHPLRYQVTLEAVRPAGAVDTPSVARGWLLDWRSGSASQDRPPAEARSSVLVLCHCPATWTELQAWAQQAVDQGQPLALAYGPPHPLSGAAVWRSVVGWVKGSIATGQPLPIDRLQHQLQLSSASLDRALATLTSLGFTAVPIPHPPIASIAQSLAQATTQSVGQSPAQWHYHPDRVQPDRSPAQLQQFLQQVATDRFLQRYFCQVPVHTLEGAIVLKR